MEALFGGEHLRAATFELTKDHTLESSLDEIVSCLP